MDVDQLVSGIVSALIALGGVYLAAHLKRRDDHDIRRHEGRQELQRLVRERSERVFTTLDKVRLTAHQVIRAGMALLDGKSDPSTHKAFAPTFPPELRREIDDIRFSLEAYLPEALGAFIGWSEETNRALAVRQAVIARALEGHSEPSDIDLYRKHANSFLRHIDELCSIIVKLCRANDGAWPRR